MELGYIWVVPGSYNCSLRSQSNTRYSTLRQTLLYTLIDQKSSCFGWGHMLPCMPSSFQISRADKGACYQYLSAGSDHQSTSMKLQERVQ